jgi:hypothetical protein
LQWPGIYTPDKYFRQYPDEFAKQFLETPMIILSGTLDPTTNPKFAQNLAGFYNKKFISFDGVSTAAPSSACSPRPRSVHLRLSIDSPTTFVCRLPTPRWETPP